jgi:cysteine desulfurase / selenocysteine lyase
MRDIFSFLNKDGFPTSEESKSLLSEQSSPQLPASVQRAISNDQATPSPSGLDFKGFQERLRSQNHNSPQDFGQQAFEKLLSAVARSAAGQPLAKPQATQAAFGRPLYAAHRPIDPISIRSDFPALSQLVNGHQLVWLDNAATTHKPQSVIDCMSTFYSRDYSNIHRAAHTLAARATDHMNPLEKPFARLLAQARPEILFLSVGLPKVST